MIHDGMTRYVRLGHLRVGLRPALLPERQEVLQSLKLHREDGLDWSHGQLMVVLSAVERHVVTSNVAPAELNRDDLLALFELCMDWEGRWDEAERLRRGVKLEVKHTAYARRDCTSCLKWWYDEDTGEIVESRGEPQLRPLYALPMCRTVGCPKGTPEDPATLTPRGWMAYRHFLDCDATNSFPDDPIVKRNARFIRKALA